MSCKRISNPPIRAGIPYYNQMTQYYQIVAYVLAAILGLCVGSFLNVVIYRVPRALNLAFPASHCPKCKHAIKWYDNIPVFSYLILSGKCRSCKNKISIRYTLVEIANMLLWLLSVHMFWKNSLGYAIVAAIVSSMFICVFFIDLEHKLIYDRFILILGIAGLLGTLLDPYYSWISHLIGGCVAFLVFYGISIIFTAIYRKEGLGGGDIKLCAVCGLLLGWQRFLLAILIASITASILLLLLTKRTKERDTEYPFAPFLTVGFAIALFAGNPIITWYCSLLGM